MAITSRSTTIAPPSISSVLASNTPVATTTTSTPAVTTSTPSAGSTASYIAQGMTLAQANAARQAANWTITTPTTLKSADPSQAEGSLWYFTSQWYDPVSAANLVKNYNTKMSNTYEVFNNPTWGTYYAQAPNGIPIQSSRLDYVWGNTGSTSTNKINTPISQTQPLNLDLSPKQKVQVGNIASSFTNALNSSKGDRSAYNSSINYDNMNANRKRVADNYFNRNSGKKEETPYDENPAITAEKLRQAEIARKQQELLDQQRADQLAADKSVMDANDARYNQEEGDTTAERDKTITEQEALAQTSESNRFNQLRWNIMSRLAQRGVDISRLSPEQITALSGEEGSKAFMDVADIKDRKTKTIEAVRQNALTKLNELRDKKSLNQTAYTSRVNEINSKTAAAKLQAEKEFGANVFSLTQTKEQQSRADALARVNAATTYLSANGISGPTAAAAIASVEKQTGYGPDQVFQIAKSPQFIAQLKAIEAANLAQKNIDNALKQGKLTIDQYDAETKRIAANRPRWRSTEDALAEFALAQFNKPA